MALNIFQTVKESISNLNPEEIREQIKRPVEVGLFAGSEQGYRQMEAFLAPSASSPGIVHRSGDWSGGRNFDIEIHGEDWRGGRGGFRFNRDQPEKTVRDITKAHPEYSIPLARNIEVFRGPVSQAIVRRIAKENAFFSLATALPDIVPVISLPWAVGEFASDTAVLTANQIRMAFLLGAANEHEIGYGEQRGEVISIVLTAFGWRAIARELVAKIPFGGGLLPKAAIAYAGTRVAGMSLNRLYREGAEFSQPERTAAYRRGLEQGGRVAGAIIRRLKRRLR